MITRAVGIYEDVEVDTFDFELSVSDVVLICSDGLSQYLKSMMNSASRGQRII